MAECQWITPTGRATNSVFGWFSGLDFTLFAHGFVHAVILYFVVGDSPRQEPKKDLKSQK